MSHCARCRLPFPFRGVNADGFCEHCCEDAGVGFVPYSGRRPNGDCVVDPCPECGHPRTGVFLCDHCDWRVNDELKQYALRDAGRRPTTKQYLMWREIWNDIPPWTDEDAQP